MVHKHDWAFKFQMIRERGIEREAEKIYIISPGSALLQLCNRFYLRAIVLTNLPHYCTFFKPLIRNSQPTVRQHPSRIQLSCLSQRLALSLQSEAAQDASGYSEISPLSAIFEVEFIFPEIRIMLWDENRRDVAR